MRLLDFFSEYYEPLRLLGRSPETGKQYRLAIVNFCGYLGRSPVLSDLLDRELAKLAGWLLSRGRSAATVNKTLRHLRALWRFAHAERFVESLPRTSNVPEPKRVPVAWTVDEIGRLLRGCDGESGKIGPLPARRFWRALILFTYDTGVRKNATLHLTPVHVELTRRTALIPAELQKQRTDQIVRYSAECAKILSEILSVAPDRRWLFPWPYDRFAGRTWCALDRRFKRICKRAGLDTMHGLFHRLRRSRATYGELVAPGSATRDLGHSARWLTERHYIDPRLLPPSDVVDRLPRPEC